MATDKCYINWTSSSCRARTNASTNTRLCPNNLTANHDLQALNTQVIEQFWGLIWTHLLIISAVTHTPQILVGGFVGKKPSWFVFFKFSNGFSLNTASACKLEREGFQKIWKVLKFFIPFFVFTAPCLLHKASDLLLNSRSSKRSEGSNEERKVPDSGNDVWSWTRTSAKRAEGKEKKWKILSQWVAMTRWEKTASKKIRTLVYKNSWFSTAERTPKGIVSNVCT